MQEIWQTLIANWSDLSSWELLAVACSILYLVLVIKENIWCWLFAFISTSIYIVLFYKVALLSESLLNVFYLIMAVYGWQQWQNGKQKNQLSIRKWSFKKHLKLILLTAIFVPILGYAMQQQGADYAYWDALTTCFAVTTTFLVTKKIFENWYYWLIIDSISMILYWQKGLIFTTFLFGGYLILIIPGIINWQQAYRKQQSQTNRR